MSPAIAQVTLGTGLPPGACRATACLLVSALITGTFICPGAVLALLGVFEPQTAASSVDPSSTAAAPLQTLAPRAPLPITLSVVAVFVQ